MSDNLFIKWFSFTNLNLTFLCEIPGTGQQPKFVEINQIKFLNIRKNLFRTIIRKLLANHTLPQIS